ncbi:MAG: peptidylprolyl isomerase [Planctomycetes bacterium]|nr:peptidylprolyl isomerase [Planctomycetota bacterium]MCB9934484.1 peptidylprolyl isomerase [Planctomycetota bacterium]
MNRPVFRLGAVAVAVIAAGALGFAAGAQGVDGKPPVRTLKVNEVARVGERVISAEEFIERLIEREKIYTDADLRNASSALDSLLIEEMLSLEAERLEAVPKIREINEEHGKLKEAWELQFKEINNAIVAEQRKRGLEEKPYSREEFLKLKYDMTPLEFDKHLEAVARQNLMRRLVVNYWRLSTDSAVAEGIYMRNLADIEKVRARLLKGEKLSVLARQYSEDMHTRQNGGLLGTAYRKDGTFNRDGTLDTTLEDAFWALEEGEYSKPTAAQDGFWVLRKGQFFPGNKAEFYQLRESCLNEPNPTDILLTKWRHATAAGGLYAYERRMPGWDCKAGEK